MEDLSAAGFLFLRALQGGKTTFSESGKKFALTPQPGETILIFKTDTGEFRKYFGIGTGEKGEKASDAMVLCIEPSAERHTLFFVELKGADYGSAVKQLKRVIGAVGEKLPSLLGTAFLTGKRRALIVSDRSAPTGFGDESERFYEETGIVLETVSTKTADLRVFMR